MSLDARDLPDGIQWHEGMLLAPQHFQQSDRRGESLLQYHAGILSPFHWGIRRLGFDPVLLANGVLRVTELEAVMPDGLVVSDPADAEEELEADLTAVEPESPREPLTVHLAVAARRRPGEPAAGTLDRYRSVEGPPVTDETGNEGAVRIPRLRPKAELVIGETAPDKFTSFPLARVSAHADSYALATYVPPHLELGARSELTDAVGDLVTRTRERAVFLAERVRAAGTARKDEGIADAARTVERLVAGLPQLEAVLRQDGVHPFSLYLALSAFAGALTGVVPGRVPPAFPAYDHDDILRTFRPLLEFCEATVEGIQQAYRTVRFQRDEDAFRVGLGGVRVGRRLVIGVTGGAEMDEADVESWFLESRIGSSEHMDSIRQRRVRGAARRRIRGDESLGVVPGTGVVLFRVERDPELVEEDGVLEISHPASQSGATRPEEIFLYAPDS